MSCGECRGKILIHHPDDAPVNAFRELLEELAEEIGSRKEAQNVVDQLTQDVYQGDAWNLRCIEAIEEAGENP